MLRAKINGKVRNVSPAMARRLRAKGIEVEGAGQAPVAAPPPVPQVKKLEDVLPPLVSVLPPPAEQQEPIEVLAELLEQKIGEATNQAGSTETLIEMPGVADAAISEALSDVERAFVETELVDASQTLRFDFKSSNVASAVLDVTTGVVMVTFTNGKSYRYGNFTADLMREWNAAESAGKWFTANVRKSDRHPQIEAPRE